MLGSGMIKRSFLVAFIGFSALIWSVQLLAPSQSDGAKDEAQRIPQTRIETAHVAPGSSGDRPSTPAPSPMVMAELHRDADSHFRAAATVNGRPLIMLVDSGASLVVLTEADARAVGMYLSPADFTSTAQTAGGPVKIAPVVIDRISVNGIERRNVAGAVVPAGLLNQSLLGQSFLGQLSEVTIRDNVMRLR